jgi:hypothetical protein
MYAVFQTTVTQWAFLLDCSLFVCFLWSLSEAGYYDVPRANDRQWALLWALFLGHYAFTKTVKLVPHLLRNPGDVRFVPVSVLFGYFHNLIKLYGCITVTEVRRPRFCTPLQRLVLTAAGIRQRGALVKVLTPTTTYE